MLFYKDLNVYCRPYRERQKGLFSFLETYQAQPDAVILDVNEHMKFRHNKTNNYPNEIGFG